MRRAIFLFWACLSVAGCDQSPNSGPSAGSADTVAVQATAGAASEQVDVTEATDQAVIDGATQQITTAGYSCAAVSHLWRLEFKTDVGMAVLRAQCSEGTYYQLTVLGGKGYVKPWTGVLAGG